MEEFFTQNSIYVVLVIVLLVWTGVFLYLTRLDAKISRLEKLVSDDGTLQKSDRQ
jgi:CcmD family protein